MKMYAKRAYEQGSLIPKHHFHMTEAVLGSYEMHPGWWDSRNRHSQVAKFRSSNGAQDVFPPLFDAVMHYVSCSHATVTGTEIIPSDGIQPEREVVQSWVMQLADVRAVEVLERETTELRRLQQLAAEKAGFGSSGKTAS